MALNLVQVGLFVPQIFVAGLLGSFFAAIVEQCLDEKPRVVFY